MQTSASTDQKAPTYRVLDALVAGTKTLTELSEATQINRRAVNAIIYSLECQSRVVAASYSVPRCEQRFAVLKYDSDTRKGHDRVHPTKRLNSPVKPAPYAIPKMTNGLEQVFFQFCSQNPSSARANA